MFRRFYMVPHRAWVILGLFCLFAALSVWLRFVLQPYQFLYIFQPISAILIAALAYYWTRGMSDRLRRKSDKLLIVAAAISAWFVIYFLSGLATTYVHNALVSTPIIMALNVITYGSFAVAIEYTRSRLLILGGRRNVLWFGTLVAIIFAIQQLNLYAMLVDRSAEDAFKYVISDIIPIFATSFLLTYLAVSAGLSSMLTYRLGLLVITLLMPITPKYDWYMTGASSLLLTVGLYVAIDRFQQGKSAEHRRHYAHIRRAYDVIFYAMIIAVVLFMTGALHYKPVSIASDSMQPVYGRGDVVIIETSVDPMDIKEGDIIQYSTSDRSITHRVISISTTSDGSGERTFITQGDNNNSPDKPVLASAVTGIVKAYIPYIGYPTIWLRSLAV